MKKPGPITTCRAPIPRQCHSSACLTGVKSPTTTNLMRSRRRHWASPMSISNSRRYTLSRPAGANRTRPHLPVDRKKLLFRAGAICRQKTRCQDHRKWGVIVPSNPKTRIFGEFIKECLEHRIKAGSKTLEGLFWKEISNSTYGKTAQGLRKKRVYDMRDKTTKELPPSKITNPFFAAYITSFTRAILGEIINSLKPDTYVFSCTTDGFITTAGRMKSTRRNKATCAGCSRNPGKC